MTKHCSSCGAYSSDDARFCRLCGAPFGATRRSESGGKEKNGGHNNSNNNSGHNRRDDVSRGDDVSVSPLAETIPLAEEGRVTENLSLDDSRGGRAPETSRVSRAEIEDMLRRPPSEAAGKRETKPHEHAPDARPDRAPHSSVNVPLPTSEIAAASLPQTSAPVQSIAAQSGARRRWPITVASLLLAAFVCGALVWFYASRKDQKDEPNAVNNAPANSTDERQAIDAQLAEASALLASGDSEGAIMRLREVIKLDSSNQPAHLKLAEALDQSGAHEEAINEYLAARKLDDQDSLAWSALAHAQFAANRFDEAAESYRRLSMLANNRDYNNEAQLEYAAALQHAGRLEEARALYLKIAAATSDDATRRIAQQRIAELTQSSAPALIAAINDKNSNARANLARPNITRQGTTSNPLPAPASAQPSSHLPFIVPPMAAASADSSRDSKRAASNDPDSYYIKGLSVLNRRDPKTLNRVEIVTALGYFQRAAQPGGTHRAAAQQFAERLGREFDKFRTTKR